MRQPERSMPIPIKRIWFNAEKTNGEHFKMIHTVENTQMHNNNVNTQIIIIQLNEFKGRSTNILKKFYKK